MATGPHSWATSGLSEKAREGKACADTGCVAPATHEWALLYGRGDEPETSRVAVMPLCAKHHREVRQGLGVP